MNVDEPVSPNNLVTNSSAIFSEHHKEANLTSRGKEFIHHESNSDQQQ